jgi:SPOR domain
MADRYQDRAYPAGDDYDSGGDRHAPARGESDPLAELARLIGQTDPFAIGRANHRVQPRDVEPEEYQEPEVGDDEPPAELPPWMQRANSQQAFDSPPEAPSQDYPSAVHPLRRYATPVAAAATDYHQAPPFDDAEQETDPSRYDEALYGQLDTGAEDSAQDLAYQDDPYAYDDSEEPEEPVRRRGGGLITVLMVFALAVLGTGAAFAYRTYVVVPRSGEPPIIKADNTPTKVVPAPADASAKVADRLATADGTEKIVPREEAPVDLNAKSAPRVVLAPMNPNQPPPVNAAPVAPPAAAPNNPLAAIEARKIKTLPVRGDQADAAATPVASPPPAAKPAPAPRTAAPKNPASANASANAPLSLSPQAPQAAPERRPRVAANNPVEAEPASAAPASAPAAGGGGYVVQVSSQRNEADAQASYKALQGKFPAVLGSHAPLIKRADLGEKGIYYRATVGPYDSPDEAKKLCSDLKAAGGQCNVVKY